MTYLVKAKIIKKFLPILLVSGVMAIGVTNATTIHRLTMENPIKTPPVEGSITEELENGAKKAAFTNDGEADVFLRVAYSETWKAKNGAILPNQAKTKENQMVSPAKPVLAGESLWEKGADGWYYYRHVLPGSNANVLTTPGSWNGEIRQIFYDEGQILAIRGEDQVNGQATWTTDYFVKEVSFDAMYDGVGKYILADDRYKDASYEIHFTMEVVQASDEFSVSKDAVKALFGKELPKPEGWDTAKYKATLTWPRN